MENKILNIVVIGCSDMARRHMDGVVAKEGAKLYGICDKHEDILKKRLEGFPDVEKAVTDYREFVNDPKVDAAVIVTPDQYHLEMTEAFLKAGKDVLCEKPMALDMEQCQKMIDAEKASGRRLMIGQVCRCTPAFLQAKKLIHEGVIGELFFVESEYAHSYAKSRGVDDWRVTPERHGFIGGGCHAVDLLRWIAGDPTEVYAIANHKCLTTWPTDDCAVAIYKFPNNVAGKVFTSIGCKRDYTMRSVFYGTNGTIICDNTSPTMTLFEDVGPLENGKSSFTKGKEIPIEINNHNITAEIDAFVNALVDGTPLPVSSLEGASTVAVCTATVESTKTGMPVKIKYPQK